MHAGSKRSGGSSTHEPPSKKQKVSDEEDPLEAFMKSINETASKQKKNAIKKQAVIAQKSEHDSIANAKQKKGERVDFDAETPMDAFIEQMQSSDTMFLPTRKGTDGYNSDEEVYNVAKYVNKLNRDKKELSNKLKSRKESDLKYDDYGNIITPDKDRFIEELEPIDHSKIWYPKIEKCFYSQHDDISRQSPVQIKQLRTVHHIHIKGTNVPPPVSSFAYFGFEDKLMDVIVAQGFSAPTPIQMQSVPTLLSGRDVMGLAKTGSGKTAAFVWPLIPHIKAQDPIEPEYDGPIALILSPTRELAGQTYKEVKRYVAPYQFRVAPLYGGLNMHEQRQMLKQGVEVIVATPGRLIDLIKDSSTNCRRITYVVIDEVDKMFSLGFEAQIRSIIGRIRSDRQLCMFSATMSSKIEGIASETMKDLVRISIGNVHLSNADITQYVEVLRDEDYKMRWITSRIRLFIRKGLVIIFVRSKVQCEKLARDLNNWDVAAGVIHGDKVQNERQQILDKFKKGTFKVLVATDVAARGVNIVEIKTVINFDCPFNMDSYIHRVGRTGRGGDKDGVAYTLLVARGETDKKMAPQLLGLLKQLRMVISPLLEQMVRGDFENDFNFKRGHNKTSHKGKAGGSKGNRNQSGRRRNGQKMEMRTVQPLMNSFVKSKEKSDDSDAPKNKQTSGQNAFVKSDGVTHVFDPNAPLRSDVGKKRKKRWD